ncbi:copper resistance protein CopC [Bacillus sp. EB600]|uniref:copper resistance protein CopC n=1 Tax=Bacillus sp. EB600 TaxID=2806345 RepID=UPI00210D3984|nr:copper resistance protein CopC [Bacillus sp. EB600]MCQ6280782.1 copper resistance protein CopC [Bacillus sp. EB600]
MNFRKNSFLLMVVLSLLLFSFPSFTYAHAYIIKSTPSENETLRHSPQKVSIQFDETIQPAFHSIQVFNSKGNQVDQKNGHIDPINSSIIECGLKQNLPNGTYQIQWKVVSSDGHPVEGVIPFQIGNGNKNQDGSTVNQESKGYTPHLDLIIIRWLQYVSNACFVGILFIYLFVLPKEFAQDTMVKNILRRLIKYSFVFLCLSIIVSLPLQATIESTSSWGTAFNIEILRNMLLNTSFGKVWIIQMDSLLFLFMTTYLLSVHRFNKPIWVWISLVLGIGLLLTKSFTSHAASSGNPILTIGMDFLHLLSASIWIGSLIVFVALSPIRRKIDSKNHYMAMIKRFSKWGIITVLILTITGVLSSFFSIPNFRSLVYTDYGKVLSGKIILLFIMMIFATINFQKGKRNSEKGLTMSLWGELTTGIIVLILAVILTNLPTAMASPGPVNKTKTLKNGNSVILHVTPNIIGKNTFEVLLKNRNGQATKDIEQITLTFTSLEMTMSDDTITLSKIRSGKYKATGMDFNMAGRWNVHVHVLTKDLETVDTDFQVFVGSQ